jgi:hypothetical protein
MDEMLLRSALRGGSDCPPIELLSARLAGAEGNEVRATAELHLGRCLHCRTELDLLHEFEAGTVRPEEAASIRWIADRLKKRPETAVVVRTPGWRTPWRMPKLVFGLASVALVALLTVGISSEWRLRYSMSQPVPEFGNEVQRTRSIEIIESSNVFSWKPVPGAARYDLTVRTVDGADIFHNSFTGTTLAFPDKVGELVKAGRLVEWEVVARNSADAEIARSGVRRLQGTTSIAH